MTVSGKPLQWVRIEPGHYEAADGLVLYEVVRVPTTFGIRRASNDMWEVRVNREYRPPRRKYLARAKADAEEFANRHGRKM